jgi:hypothetical protein
MCETRQTEQGTTVSVDPLLEWPAEVLGDWVYSTWPKVPRPLEGPIVTENRQEISNHQMFSGGRKPNQVIEGAKNVTSYSPSGEANNVVL